MCVSGCERCPTSATLRWQSAAAAVAAPKMACVEVRVRSHRCDDPKALWCRSGFPVEVRVRSHRCDDPKALWCSSGFPVEVRVRSHRCDDPKALWCSSGFPVEVRVRSHRCDDPKALWCSSGFPSLASLRFGSFHPCCILNRMFPRCSAQQSWVFWRHLSTRHNGGRCTWTVTQVVKRQALRIFTESQRH